MRLYERVCGAFAVLQDVRFQPSGVRFAGFIWLRRVLSLPRGYGQLYGRLRGFWAVVCFGVRLDFSGRRYSSENRSIKGLSSILSALIFPTELSVFS